MTAARRPSPIPDSTPSELPSPGALRRVMLLMGAFLVFVQVHRAGGAVIASALDEARGLAPTDLGAIMGTMFLAAAVVQLPAGVLYDRYGPRRTLSAMSCVAVAGTALFAVADTVSGLVLGRLLIGLGHGAVIAGIYLLAIAWAPPERVATVAATVIALAGGLGGMLATTPLSIALSRAGFAVTFGVLAVAIGVLTGAIFLFLRDAPQEGGAPAPRGAETVRQSLHGLWEVASDRELLRVFAMGSCFAAPFMTIGGLWAGPYLRDVHGLDQEQSSYVIFAMVLAVNLGYLAYGPLDRLLDTRKWVVLGGVAGMIAALLALAAPPRPPLAAAVALLVAFAFCSPFFVTLAAHCRGFVPVHRAGRAIACINLAGLTGVFVLQAATGVVVEAAAGGAPASGYRLTFLCVAAVLAAAGGIYAGVRDVPVRAAQDG